MSMLVRHCSLEILVRMLNFTHMLLREITFENHVCTPKWRLLPICFYVRGSWHELVCLCVFVRERECVYLVTYVCVCVRLRASLKFSLSVCVRRLMYLGKHGFV